MIKRVECPKCGKGMMAVNPDKDSKPPLCMYCSGVKKAKGDVK
jgi:hypothetical protein